MNERIKTTKKLHVIDFLDSKKKKITDVWHWVFFKPLNTYLYQFNFSIIVTTTFLVIVGNPFQRINK